MKIILRSLLLLLPVLCFTQLKSPSEFLGYELGSQFTRHHQVVDYYQYLAEQEPARMQLIAYGKTNERRPLLLAYISSKENINTLENIRLEHLKDTKSEGVSNKAIVWLSYNVHGNESVSTEASMQTIYDLLTTKSDYLKNTVVIMDPCINPDGRDRYVNWYNQYKNTPFTVDPNSKEHHEDWWSGRSNHYMFDLNRDWAWLTQVESQQRLRQFNKWLPHIHVDFHEQGVNNPYYFAPAAEPYHEVITDFQREFQAITGKNHAKYFDKNGWFYFTKEVFDLLYPSYGDTYPMYNGGIGMTYEQGGSGRAGLGIITSIKDTLTLKDRIAHHHTTGLSTVEVASMNTEKLNTEFKKFYQNKNFKYKNYILNGNSDKLEMLANLLEQHEIEFGKGGNTTYKGYRFNTGKAGTLKGSEKSLIVTTNQPKGTLVKVLFEPKTKLVDSVTYDITAWSLPYAYGLDALATENSISSSNDGFKKESRINTIKPDNYAYIADWDSMKDAKFLAYLLTKEVRVRYAQKPFTLEGTSYKRGSLIITKADNKNIEDFFQIIKDASLKFSKDVTATDTGFVERGKDFGSSSVEVIPDVKIAVLSGKPTSTLRFGEIWHFFEQQLNYPITVLDESYFNKVDLSTYDVLILPDGKGYSNFMKQRIMQKIKSWVTSGGKLITMGKAISLFSKDDDFKIKKKEKKKDTTASLEAFDTSKRELIKSEITGAIFKATVDPTHPLAYGYDNTYFTLKLGSDAYDYLEDGNVAYLGEQASVPVSGFAGSEAQKSITKTLIFGTEKIGEGHVIYMVDNPLFRGFWENGKLFFANALFMVN